MRKPMARASPPEEGSRERADAAPATTSAPRKRARIESSTSVTPTFYSALSDCTLPSIGHDASFGNSPTHDPVTQHLIECEPQFKALVAAHGPAASLTPVAIPKGGAFPALLKTIVYQQVRIVALVLASVEWQPCTPAC